MDIRQLLFEAIGALIACSGFAAIYRNKKRRIFFCGLAAMLTWISCAIASYLTGNDLFMSYMIAAAIGTIISEVLARVLKAPATVFLIIAILPLVPGGSLYHATFNLVTKNYTNAKLYGTETAVCALGIAVGLILISVGFNLWCEINQRFILKKLNS